jgi:NAD(P)-dependent dehydrogenase (short-subunit alcohol dehydrogenase family)
VADSLLAAVARLRTRLKDRPEGDVWLDYLQLDSVARLAEELSGGGRLDALAGEAGISGRAARLLDEPIG